MNIYHAPGERVNLENLLQQAANVPVLSFMNGSTIVIHGAAFVMGIMAAVICRLFGMR